MPGPRAFAGGHFMLDLDGANAGWLASAEGGDAFADVVQEKVGADHIVHKHIAGVKYSDIQIAFGTGMSPSLYQWISDTLAHSFMRKNGALIAADLDFKERERLTFMNALISHIDFPLLDASSKDSAEITLGLAPEQTTRSKGSGAKVTGQVDTKAQKKWLPANFKLEIDGLDCKGVSRIEAMSIKQVTTEDPVGEVRHLEKEPSHLDIPDLVVTLAEAKAEDFYNWHEDFVIKGNCDDAHEKSGNLQLLDPTKQQALFTLTFSGLGIYKLAGSTPLAGTEGIRKVTASLYCEQMALAPGGVQAAPITPVPPDPLAPEPATRLGPEPVVVTGDRIGRRPIG